MRRRIVLILAVIAALAGAPAPAAHAGPCGAHPWCDPALPPDVRANLVLEAMTPQEKYELMGGQVTQEINSINEAIPRLGLPLVRFTDGPAGIRQTANPEGRTTQMPAPLALAATFDPGLARLYAATVADEARRKGRAVLLAPTMNLVRTPLNGRTFETFGEDPWLMSRIAVPYVEGVQAQRVAADPKHYAVNNQEGIGFVPGTGGAVGSRQTTNAIVDDRTLRELYLPHFEAVVKEAKAATIMLAYNRVNGQYAAEHDVLVNQILKGEWGFDGFALSDYLATRSTIASANNGLDLELPQAAFYRPEPLAAAVAASQVSREAIDDHVRRILRVMFRFGMVDEGTLPTDLPIDEKGHAAVSRRVAETGAVLLRNEGGRLPLDAQKVKTLALIGSYASQNQGGGGSAQVTPFTTVAAREAIRNRVGPGMTIRYNDGREPGTAAAVARGADAAIVFVADSQDEFGDKPCLSLRCGSNPGHAVRDQDALIAAVAAANPETIVVMQAGGPVLTPWRGAIKALLQVWYPGQMGGEAMAALLFGDANPSGKLPTTFPAREDDGPLRSPEQYPGVAEDARYSEGVFVGYRHYDERGLEPAYPFGFGLSYTTFAYGGLRVERRDGEAVRVSAEVRNTGAREGAEVAQLYVAMPDPRPGVEQPPRQLKGFERVTLRPGQRRRVTFDLDARSFAYWDTRTNGWAVAPGCYGIAVGGSSRDLPLNAVVGQGGARCAGELGLPSARRCLSRRDFRIRLREPRGAERLRSARVTVDGRRVKVRRRGGRLTARVDLRGKRRKRVVVRVVARTTQGRTIRETRRYRTCAPRRRR